METIKPRGAQSKGRRLVSTLFAAMLLVALGAGPAAAFEPPADPAGVFTGGGVAGHPGSVGQAVATGTDNTRAAWNAHDHSDMIDN